MSVLSSRYKARWALLGLWALATSVSAHELKSVVLHLDESAAETVQVTLKSSLARDGSAVAVVPQFNPDCRALGIARVERQGDIVIRQWQMRCTDGLDGTRLRFDGLDPSTPEAVVIARFENGIRQTVAVDRHDPAVTLQSATNVSTGVGLLAYLPLGIEHILSGADHLLFVLGLMLVVHVAGSGAWMLIAALTAFTLAHSLTLALAVLGVWGLPPKPVEILIALSIVLLAVELARHPLRIAQQLPAGFTLRKPWAVAFVFGLLHGFGFAGALSAIGLPPEARGWALFLFNLGVEAGQLLFVAVVLGSLFLIRRLQPRILHWARLDAMVIALGGVAMYWTLGRVLVWTSTLQPGT